MAVATRNRVKALYDGTEAVVGQVRARQQMSVLLDRQWAVAEGRLPKSGGAIVGGRSGVGKTLLCRLMCEQSGLPFAEVNATRYTEAGYAGLDLAQMFLPLLDAAARMKDEREEASWKIHGEKVADEDSSTLKRGDIDQVVELAECGVILLDEFDKWMLRVNHVTGQTDTAIQADLLKMIEGSHEYVSDQEDEVGLLFDTSKVLIICAGAFVNLQRQTAARQDKEPTDESIWEHIDQEDFVKFGLIPELAGRLATHIFLRPLKTGHLAELLSAEDGVLDEYKARFAAVDCEWAVTPEGVQYIAEQAIRAETGARAVDHIMHKTFSKALYLASVSERPTRVTYHVNWHEARVE